MRLRASWLAALLMLVPPDARGYGTRVHELLPVRILAPWVHDTAPGITDADLAGFRSWLYQQAAAIPDTAIRGAFLRRYPSPARFDARAMKELLMMDGAAKVLGIDSLGAVTPATGYLPGAPIPRMRALQLGSTYPDLDRRNQNRLLRDGAGLPLRTARGDSIPFDPMTLNMGGLTGLSSQAHAHYGLNKHAKSSDPAVLKSAPWDFAIAASFPGPVETYAPDNAQLYTDLALLASLDGRPSSSTLGTLFAGNALHYVADVGNAIHTVQVGIYPIFVDATVQYWVRRATHLFGLLGPTPSRNEIGIGIITNLHTFSERLYEIEVAEALEHEGPGSPIVRALTTGDDSLARILARELPDAAEPAPPFGREIADQLVAAGFHDGAEVYRLTRQMVIPSLRTGRVVIDFDTLSAPATRRWAGSGRSAAEAERRFLELETKDLGRTVEAIRFWWVEFRRQANVPAARRRQLIESVVTRLVGERLAYLAAAEARRDRWIADHGGLAR